MVEAELTWHQAFLAEAMQADSLNDLSRRLTPYLEDADRAALQAALGRFQERFGKVWRDLSHVRRFDTRFRKFLDDGKLMGFLNSLAVFLDVDPAGLPPMQLSFMALPSDGSTHAEADGEETRHEITGELRFLNHSCRPNAELRAFRLTALRPIPKGQEILIDYGDGACTCTRDAPETEGAEG